MTASADIQTRTRANILSVPINAVTTRDKVEKEEMKGQDNDKKGAGQDDAAPVSADDDDKQIVVFLLDSAKSSVKKAVVTTGIQDTRFIEITSGLKPGDVIVSEPYNTIYKILKDGMKVNVVDKSKLFEVKK